MTQNEIYPQMFHLVEFNSLNEMLPPPKKKILPKNDIPSAPYSTEILFFDLAGWSVDKNQKANKSHT